jgi:hypothetical protein
VALGHTSVAGGNGCHCNSTLWVLSIFCSQEVSRVLQFLRIASQINLTPTLIQSLWVFEGNYRLLLPIRSTRAHNKRNRGHDRRFLFEMYLWGVYAKISVGCAQSYISDFHLTFSITQRVSSGQKVLDFAKQICLRSSNWRESTLNGLQL